MPSEFSNLNFVAKWDIANWKEKCAEQRKIALQWPAYDKRMALCEDYEFKIGPWHIVFYLQIWDKHPLWVGGASIQEQIAYETVVFDKGPLAGAKAEVPQDALLAISSWEPEHFEQARFILAETFGEILRAGDKHQPAQEFQGLFALQWRVPFEGKPTWKNRQH